MLSFTASSCLAAVDDGAPPVELATVAKAVNALGVALLAKSEDSSNNALLSPYSIQSALAMSYAGAVGPPFPKWAWRIWSSCDYPTCWPPPKERKGNRRAYWPSRCWRSNGINQRKRQWDALET